jgi:hypothetical protein
MATSRNADKQNVTISLGRQVLRKAKVIAARRETSISHLPAQQIVFLVGEEDKHAHAERQAIALGAACERRHQRKTGRIAKNRRHQFKDRMTDLRLFELGKKPHACRAGDF